MLQFKINYSTLKYPQIKHAKFIYKIQCMKIQCKHPEIQGRAIYPRCLIVKQKERPGVTQNSATHRKV